MKTVHVASVFPAPAGRVWEALQHPASFLYVVRGLFRIPSLEGRTEPYREGESGSGWIFLFHVIPLHRHHATLESIDHDEMTMKSREHGGVIRSWRHTLRVEPLDNARCRYHDVVEIDAGDLTPLVAAFARLLYRYRHRRWRRLVLKHLVERRDAPRAT
ncbi:MAG TPA: hypothetical protein VHI54_08530 [Actinomycetota bacterium]|nr:hypothetical protein [Actinomycetota bacterium]